MQQVNYFKKDNGHEKTGGQTNVWGTEAQAFPRSDPKAQFDEGQSVGRVHACRASQREYQQARDRLKRANRDLGETAAFIAATLTSATAIQAVITFAEAKLVLPPSVPQLAFTIYILVIIGLVVLGVGRGAHALLRRKQAERLIDRTKKGIYDFCSVEEWPKGEE